MTKLSFLPNSISLFNRQGRGGVEGRSPVQRNDDHTSMDSGKTGLNFEVLRRGR